VDTLAVGGDARRDFGLALAVPLYDGGFGQRQPAADGSQAQALDAKAEEFIAGRLWVHGRNGFNR
jgi:hypothetical protein